MIARAVSLIVAVLLLAACAPRVAPANDMAANDMASAAGGAAALADGAFVAADGVRLPLRRWLPADGAPRAVVLALHGFNDYSKAFDAVPDAPGVGPFLAARGIAVYAYDQRGFGASPRAGRWAGRDAMAGDFRDAAAALRAAWPGVPVYALGESMGGAVVIAGLADAPPGTVDGAILAAPAVWARSTMPLSYRVALWVGVRLMPGFKPSGRGLGYQASDNIEMLRDNGRDPLFIKETRIDAIYGLTNLMDEALARVGELDVPLLYLYGDKDEIIPKEPTRRALAALAAAGRTPRVAFYPDGWHMLLRDRGAAAVLGDVAAFIAAPAAPLPSGAGADALARLQGVAAR